MKTRRIARAGLVAALCMLLSAASFAQYPNHTVTLVVPFPPGGGTDTGARLVATKLGQKWQQVVLIDNKPGAAGLLGADFVSKAKPDGYTLMMGNIGTQSINPSLYKKITYNPDTAFVPITLVAELPLVMLTNANFPAKSAKDVIAIAKAQPGKITYSSSGTGSSMHLAGALFENASGTEMLHIPYKGGGPAIADLIAGHIDIAFATVLESSGHIKSGRLRALAATSTKRSPALPDVPTLAETVMPEFNTGSWIGILAPAGTPAAIVEQVARDVHEAVNSPDVREQFVAQGATPVGGTPAEFKSLIDSDRVRYAKIIKEKNISAE
jgi:tripartite-type tricarboxylate transporter receptor subunit TctC